MVISPAPIGQVCSGSRRALGVDFGRRRDSSVAVVLDYSKPIVKVDATMEYLNGSYSDHLSSINSVSNEYGCDPVLADATGVGDALYGQVDRAIGVVIIADRKTKRVSQLERASSRISLSHRELFAPLFHLINTRSIIAADDPRTRQQLLNFCLKFSKTGALRFEAIREHDDRVFALALAAYGATYYGKAHSAQAGPSSGPGEGRHAA